jgi:metal-responsive CopG/Arc/MetJ family transcriptional regulator
MKVGITLDDKLLQRIDDYADENYMSRSGLISLAATQFLNAADVSRAVRDLSLAMQKIAETGDIDEETKRQLDDFSRAAKFLTPSK